jgi:phosphate transport system permease protein
MPDVLERAVELPVAAAVGDASDVPRRIGGLRFDDGASVVGAFVSSLALVWLVYVQLLPWSGKTGFVICWWLAFLAIYTGVSAIDNPGPIVRDRLGQAFVTSGALVVMGALLWTLEFVFAHGYKALLHSNFFTDDMGGVVGTAPLTQGGIKHALVGTAIQIGIATVISLPLGVATAVYLTEVGGRLAVVVRTVVEAMTALPDILAGLFVYALLIIGLGWEKTGLAVSIALAVTMIPVVARSSEVTLRVVASGLREASLALGATRWRTVWNVVLPTARSGLATALILGVARITGETAPLLIVSGSSTFFNDDPLHGPMNSLPLFIFAAIKTGQGGASDERAYGAALVLLVFVLTLFVTARFLARDKTGRR